MIKLIIFIDQQHIEVTLSPAFAESMIEVSYLVMPSGLMFD